MMMRPSPPINPEALREVTVLMDSGADLDTAIARMRSLGLNKIESILILRDHAGIPVGEGKKIVHFSASWSDRLESDNALHETVYEAGIEDGWVEDQAPVAEHPVHSSN